MYDHDLSRLDRTKIYNAYQIKELYGIPTQKNIPRALRCALERGGWVKHPSWSPAHWFVPGEPPDIGKLDRTKSYTRREMRHELGLPGKAPTSVLDELRKAGWVLRCGCWCVPQDADVSALDRSRIYTHEQLKEALGLYWGRTPRSVINALHRAGWRRVAGARPVSWSCP